MDSRTEGRIVAAVLAGLLAAPAWSYAQEPVRGTPPSQETTRGQRAQPRAGRAAVPPLARNMDAQQLQAHLDAYALVQAERDLKLTAEQYPNFVAKLSRLQNVRRQTMLQRRRLFGELRSLLESPSPREDAILEKLRAIEDVNRRGADELVKSYQEVDAALTPWQRGRFRLFEEQLERRKIELLAKIR